MRKGRFSQEQIIAILREQEAGMATAEVCRRYGISSATFYAWKSKYGGLEVSEAKRLTIVLRPPLNHSRRSFRATWPRWCVVAHGHLWRHSTSFW